MQSTVCRCKPGGSAGSHTRHGRPPPRRSSLLRTAGASGALERGISRAACDGPAGSSPMRTWSVSGRPDSDAGGGGHLMITALVITLVVIALAAGFILNRDETRLRP